jgi:hypothetical protein
MRRHLLSYLLLASTPLFALQETWETGYMGEDATGKHVLGYWTFDGDQPLADTSGKGNALTLNGATLSPNGHRGAALESAEGFPVSDQPHQARVTGKARLSPTGPFTLDLWLNPKPEFDKGLRCYLLDKKYTPDTHTDYALQLTDADKSGTRRLQLSLGFGSHSAIFYSEPLRLASGQWQHLAITYDAAGSTTFYLNGSTHSRSTQPGLGAVVPGTRPLTLGDRNGSNYGGFPGLLDDVRLCDGALKFEPVELAITSSRSVWRRLEKAEPIQIACTNLRREPISGATLVIDFGPRSETITLPTLAPGKPLLHPFNLNTALKAGPYSVQARLSVGTATASADLALQLTPRPLPDQMPVIMWGAGGDEIPRLKDIGFTHFIGFSAGVGETWAQKKEMPPGDPDYIARNLRYLDNALAAGLSVVAGASPAHFFDNKPEFLRVGRDGKPFERLTLHASHPELPPFFENVGRSLARAYGRHPAFTTVLINTEVRDGSRPSFNPIDIANYRAFASTDIPPEVNLRTGVDYKQLKDFPADRVVPDDHPILKYYRWFWTVGDGWNALHSALNKGVKTTGRSDLWTFFDPATRQPSLSGAGGTVDALSHWTYTYPDPQRIGLATDQLFAMRDASARNQKVMKMTQLIWYRSQTSPIKKAAPENPVPWEDHDPDAAYITIAPMHLKQAFWTKLSRPVQGIMYHGWQSLVPNPESSSAYRYTNPNTVHVLKDLIHTIAQPLGPTLLKVPDERREIAFLESFTSQMFARRGGHGYNGTWSADLFLALQHAHHPADILFEETLLKNGLTGRKLLVMSECDVLSASVLAKIKDWQAKGGKILADEHLCPALKADLILPSFKRVKNATQDKAKLLELAATLRQQIGRVPLTPTVTADNPEVILRTRRAGDATYLFLINDHREAGSYVGQHGLVLENGLPSTTTVTLPQETAHLYDLTRSAQVIPDRNTASQVTWKADLGPCDGKLYLITPKPLLGLQLEAPTTAKRGNPVKLDLRVTTTSSALINAVIPISLQIKDANGTFAEGSGHYAADKGQLTVTLDLPPNEDPGTWEITACELASRMTTTHFLKVEP